MSLCFSYLWKKILVYFSVDKTKHRLNSQDKNIQNSTLCQLVNTACWDDLQPLFYFKWTEGATWYFLQNQQQRQDKMAVIKAHNDTSGDLLMGPEKRRRSLWLKSFIPMSASKLWHCKLKLECHEKSHSHHCAGIQQNLLLSSIV